MTTAIERVIEASRARTAAIGDAVTPPPPVPPTPSATVDAQAFADLQDAVAQLSEDVGALQEAAVEDTLDDMEQMSDPAMVAALPPAPAPDAEEASEPAVGDTVTVNGAKYVVSKVSEDDGGTLVLREAVPDAPEAAPKAEAA